MRGLGPEEGVLRYEPSVGITHGRLGLTGSYKCWFAVMPLSLKAPYSPGRAAAAVWFCLMMVSGSHAPPGMPFSATPHTAPRGALAFVLSVCLYLFWLSFEVQGAWVPPLFSWGWRSRFLLACLSLLISIFSLFLFSCYYYWVSWQLWGPRELEA